MSRPEGETAPATTAPPKTAPPKTGPAQTGPPEKDPGPVSLKRQLLLLVLDIGAPIGLYYGLRNAGMSNLVAP